MFKIVLPGTQNNDLVKKKECLSRALFYLTCDIKCICLTAA